MVITGFSQGGTYVNAAAAMEVWMYPGDYIPVMGVTTGWTLVGSATVALVNGGYSQMIPVTGVVELEKL